MILAVVNAHPVCKLVAKVQPPIRESRPESWFFQYPVVPQVPSVRKMRHTLQAIGEKVNEEGHEKTDRNSYCKCTYIFSTWSMTVFGFGGDRFGVTLLVTIQNCIAIRSAVWKRHLDWSLDYAVMWLRLWCAYFKYFRIQMMFITVQIILHHPELPCSYFLHLVKHFSVQSSLQLHLPLYQVAHS